mmetsp:Transcript_48145/g.89417  ORF Transcript_48145/g.89417 Transcript_48145/m.89417 type:complete len:667 (-) Transcript_48145:55-2055(-)
MSRPVSLSSALAVAVFWLFCLIAEPIFAHSVELSPSTQAAELGVADASLPTDDAIASMNHRLAQLELENRKLRDRLGLAEETTTQPSSAQDDSRSLADIFASLAAELAELGPDLALELAALLLIGGLVLLVTKGLYPPAVIASKAATTKAEEELAERPWRSLPQDSVQKEALVSSAQGKVFELSELLKWRGAVADDEVASHQAASAAMPSAVEPAEAAACTVETKPAAHGKSSSEGAEPLNLPDTANSEVDFPDVTQQADEVVAAASLGTPPGLEHPGTLVEEHPSSTTRSQVLPADADDCNTGGVELELESSTTPACVDPGAPPGLEHVSLAPLTQDVLEQQSGDQQSGSHTIDDEKEAHPQDDAVPDVAEGEADAQASQAAEGDVEQSKKLEEGEPAALPKVMEHKSAASGSEPESEPKVSRNLPPHAVKTDDAVPTKRARATRSKKTRQNPKTAATADTISGDANSWDDPDEFAQLPSGKMPEGSARRHDRPQSKKKGRQQQKRLEAPKRSVEDATSRRAWRCHWPCSWQLTLALGVMLGITLVGKVVRAPSVAEQRHENLEQLKAKRNQMARQLALMKLEQIHREALATAQSLPAEADKSLLLGVSSDAKNLLGALKDVADADFPTVEKDVDQMLAHWKTKIVAAKSRAESGGAPQCAASND